MPGSHVVATSSLSTPPEEIIFGRSDAMRTLRSKLDKLASANLPILIYGESGTGKEVIARFIHRRSRRADGPFIRLNLATPGESRLFDHPAEMGQGGSLFLEEVADLDPALQVRLVRSMQDNLFRNGSDQKRLICATTRRLQDEVEAGRFRQDLLFRINVLSLEVPPLRDRRADIALLAAYFVQALSAEFNTQVRPLSQTMLRMLEDYDWPGNIREFENLMKRYVVLGSETAISAELLIYQRPQTPKLALNQAAPLKKLTRQAVREVERQVILRALETTNWNRKRAARVLDISYRALLYKIRDAGLQASKSRPPKEQETANAA